MSDTVSLEVWLSEIAAFLENISQVLAAEHKWLKPKIDECRQELEEEIKGGWKGPDDLDFDSPLLWRKQVDTHLENLEGAAQRIEAVVERLRQAAPVPE